MRVAIVFKQEFYSNWIFDRRYLTIFTVIIYKPVIVFLITLKRYNSILFFDVLRSKKRDDGRAVVFYGLRYSGRGELQLGFMFKQ